MFFWIPKLFFASAVLGILIPRKVFNWSLNPCNLTLPTSRFDCTVLFQGPACVSARSHGLLLWRLQRNCSHCFKKCCYLAAVEVNGSNINILNSVLVGIRAIIFYLFVYFFKLTSNYSLVKLLFWYHPIISVACASHSVYIARSINLAVSAIPDPFLYKMWSSP